MSLFDSHIDGRLDSLAQGKLAPRTFRSMLQHAKTCHRCGTLYQSATAVIRQLENGSPFEPASFELQAIETYNQPRVKVAPQPRRWLIAVGAMAVAVLLGLVWLRVPEEDSFTARGSGSGAATLRCFCTGMGQTLREVAEGGTCQKGQSIAVAVGAQGALRTVVVKISGPAVSNAATREEVTGVPGAEAPIALTVRLEREGSVNIVAAFGAEAFDAEKAGVVLRRTISVVP